MRDLMRTSESADLEWKPASDRDSPCFPLKNARDFNSTD
jgi:hypothetical protein